MTSNIVSAGASLARAKCRSAAGVLLLALALAGCAPAGPVGNASVPQPTKTVDLTRYTRSLVRTGALRKRLRTRVRRRDGRICRQSRTDKSAFSTPAGRAHRRGPAKTVEGSARVVPESGNAKFKVSFFGPFYVGNYWIIDRAPDYSWSIVGEPSGRYLWLLSRTKSKSALATMTRRAKALGYDTSLLRVTAQ